jgi:hypothetical protein
MARFLDVYTIYAYCAHPNTRFAAGLPSHNTLKAADLAVLGPAGADVVFLFWCSMARATGLGTLVAGLGGRLWMGRRTLD